MEYYEIESRHYNNKPSKYRFKSKVTSARGEWDLSREVAHIRGKEHTEALKNLLQPLNNEVTDLYSAGMWNNVLTGLIIIVLIVSLIFQSKP